MTIDVFSILLGRPVAPIAPSKWPEALASVRCRCGRALAAVTPSARGRLVQSVGWKLTRAHTLMIVVDAAMNDVDAMAARVQNGDQNAARMLDAALVLVNGDTDRLLGRLPPLEIPGLRDAHLDEIADAVVAAEQDAKERGALPAQITNLTVSCRSCRSVYYLGGHLLHLKRNPQVTTLVASDPSRHSHITTGSWPEAGAPMRARLYSHLSDVLTSAL